MLVGSRSCRLLTLIHICDAVFARKSMLRQSRRGDHVDTGMADALHTLKSSIHDEMARVQKGVSNSLKELSKKVVGLVEGCSRAHNS